MSTTTTPPTNSTLTTSGAKIKQPGNRLAIASTAFLAILRRDIVITGREFIVFLVQVLLQPLFFIFIFGKVLPSIGFAQHGFAAVLLPGIVALTVVTTALQGVTLPLVLDLGFAREIDDRLLAPLPVSMVAVEKVIFAAMRGMVAGAIIFPLAYWILGNDYSVRSDDIAMIIGLMILTAFAGASLGLTIGTLVKPEQIGLMFSVIFTPLIFTGCTYYPWSSLDSIKWFQVITLFNPLTYAAEGLRSAMVPAIHGHTIPTLATGWVILGLSVTFVAFLIMGIRTFQGKVVN